MTHPVLALVESNTTGTGRMFAVAARERGLRPVLLSSRPERYPWVAEDGVDVAWVDTSEAAAVAAGALAAADGGALAGLVTSSEYFVAVTARAASRLGLPAADAGAVERCRDKRRQRAALAGCGVSVPAYTAAATPAEAVEAATAIGLPVVVKPADGTGSRGVRLCATAGEVRCQAAALLAQDRDERGQPILPAVLVEEFVAGPELSVETFGTEVVGITAKYLGPPPWFVEIGHDFPWPLTRPLSGGHPPTPGPAVGLSGLDAEDVGTVALAALDALGLGFGPAHTEIRLGTRGPVVIEVNPRLAGGRIPTLVRLASGLDLVGATVDGVIGRGDRLAAPRPGCAADQWASVRFLVPSRAGRVRRTGGVAAAAAVPGVVDVGITARAGQRVGGTGSFLDRVGHVIAAGPTATSARTAAETALTLLELDIDTLVDDAVPAVG